MFLAAVVVSAVAPVQSASAIVNGEVTQEYPWAVAFVREAVGTDAGKPVGERVSCSGVLVDSRWVMTAAHCQLPRETIQVVIGRDNLGEPDGEKRSIAPYNQAHYRYPDYVDLPDGQLSQYDVMLVKLDQPSTKQVLPLAGPGVESYWGDDKVARMYGYGPIPAYNQNLRAHR